MDTSLLRVGISGHQNLGDEATRAFVADHFRSLLISYQEKGYQLIVCGALAQGADQLFLSIALELHLPLEIVLPCDEYEQTLSSEQGRTEYHRILSACRAVHPLPFHHCSDDAFLAAGRWIVDQSDVVVVAWNGQPPKGRGGTGDVASYAWFMRRPFIHLHTRHHTVHIYGRLDLAEETHHAVAPKRDFVIDKHTVYQGKTLAVTQYQLQMPDGTTLIRDIVERPESVLVLPVASQNIILLVEEYDLGAGVWQLKLPGGKVEEKTPEGRERQALKELRQEIGYQAGCLDKLVSFYSHPGYVAHQVHLFVAQDLEWNPLERDAHEEIRVQTYTLQEALEEIHHDYRVDPEAALALLLYAQQHKMLR